MKNLNNDTKIGVIGLGYVGLPVAIQFSTRYAVTAFDIDKQRIAELSAGVDRTQEADRDALSSAERLYFTADADRLTGCDVFVVTVPTPIDSHKRPDLSLLLQASETVGKAIGRGAIVVFESTVYPGATEDECVPAIERASGMRFNEEFFVGYSPERINPGDKTHRIDSIVKVTSGSTPDVAEFVDELYRSVVPAGTFKASSIRVAEAAKVIENTQRDLNIALVNELAIIFNRLGLETQEVLEAAGTKWNFLPFRPGLVGGHCIGVDPYYLTHKAQAAGYHPEIILAGRRINDGMGAYVVGQLVKKMIRKRIQVEGSRILVMGLAFKENCRDMRNSRVVDIVRELREFNVAVDLYDPWVETEDARLEYGFAPVAEPETGAYDAIVLAVAHKDFLELGIERIRGYGKPTSVVYDLKNMFSRNDSDLRL